MYIQKDSNAYYLTDNIILICKFFVLDYVYWISPFGLLCMNHPEPVLYVWLFARLFNALIMGTTYSFTAYFILSRIWCWMQRRNFHYHFFTTHIALCVFFAHDSFMATKWMEINHRERRTYVYFRIYIRSCLDFSQDRAQEANHTPFQCS